MSVFLGGLLLLAEIILFQFSSEIAILSRYMLPGVFFICLFGLTSGLLQSEKSFFIPSVAPVFFNLVWIAGVFVFHALPIEKAVLALSLVLSVAFFLQWAVTIPKMWAFLRQYLSPKQFFQPALFSPLLKKLVQPLLLGIVGVASMQINSAIDGVFARFASLEGPAYLWYAIRMQQLPLALFGIALSSALLPSFSRATKEQFDNLLQFAIKRSFTLIFPCTIAIFVLGASSVNLLFGRGDFTQIASTQTILCLWGYGLGLLPAALALVFAPAFYARKDYKTPMKGFCIAAAINIALDALLVFYFHLGPVSIALATSISAAFNALYLYFHLRPNNLPVTHMIKVATATLLAGGITFLFGSLLGDPTTNFIFPRIFTVQIAQFALQTILFGGLFLILCKSLGVTQLDYSK